MRQRGDEIGARRGDLKEPPRRKILLRAIRDELVRRQSISTGGYWSDSICNEYGTAMALITASAK